MNGHGRHQYYFSTKSLTLVTIFLVSFTWVFSFLFITTYEDDTLVGIIFLAPLVIILPIALPDYLKFMFYAVTNRPAVVVTQDELVDNVNGQTYKWSDIKEIKYKPFTGMKAPPGGYTAVTLRKADKEIRISHNSIKCKATEFLQTLIKYHKQNRGR